MSKKPVQSKGDARLAALVGAATELFLDKGYEAVSLDEIISRAGGSRRNIYESFGGKEGLFRASILKLCEDIVRPIADTVVEGEDLRDNLLRLGHLFSRLSLNEQAIELHRLMVAEGRRFPDLAQAIYQAGRSQGVKAVTPLIEHHRCNVSRCSVDLPSLDLAEMFVSIVIDPLELHALIGLEHSSSSLVGPQARVEAAVDLFVRGLFNQEKNGG